jgi:hypothetical protein
MDSEVFDGAGADVARAMEPTRARSCRGRLGRDAVDYAAHIINGLLEFNRIKVLNSPDEPVPALDRISPVAAQSARDLAG